MGPTPDPAAIERNNHDEGVNDIRPNDNAIMERIPHPVFIEQNNHHEDDNDIRPNDIVVRIDPIELNIDDDLVPIVPLNNIRIAPNYGTFRGNLPVIVQIDDEDENEREDEQEIYDHANERERIGDISNWNTTTLDPFNLEHIKNVLYVGLHQLFDEFEIDIVRCPDLTEPPYNLAADGLSGNTSVCDLGDEYNNLVPVPLKDKIYDIRDIFLRYTWYDSFIIGTGYAAKESMPSNGHFTINATISSSTSIINNSRIVYEEANTGRKVLNLLNNPNELKFSMLCTYFRSEGRKGNVIKVRAKGRRSNHDIITLMQNCLYYYHPEDVIALGGVLKIDKGRMMYYITPENYPERFLGMEDFNNWLKCHVLDCENLITVGAIVNFESNDLGPLRNEETNLRMTNSLYKFNVFSDYEAAGQFINNVTPNETEYIGYFNVAEKYHFAY